MSSQRLIAALAFVAAVALPLSSHCTPESGSDGIGPRADDPGKVHLGARRSLSSAAQPEPSFCDRAVSGSYDTSLTVATHQTATQGEGAAFGVRVVITVNYEVLSCAEATNASYKLTVPSLTSCTTFDPTAPTPSSQDPTDNTAAVTTTALAGDVVPLQDCATQCAWGLLARVAALFSQDADGRANDDTMQVFPIIAGTGEGGGAGGAVLDLTPGALEALASSCDDDSEHSPKDTLPQLWRVLGLLAQQVNYRFQNVSDEVEVQGTATGHRAAVASRSTRASASGGHKTKDGSADPLDEPVPLIYALLSETNVSPAAEQTQSADQQQHHVIEEQSYMVPTLQAYEALDNNAYDIPAGSVSRTVVSTSGKLLSRVASAMAEVPMVIGSGGANDTSAGDSSDDGNSTSSNNSTKAASIVARWLLTMTLKQTTPPPAPPPSPPKQRRPRRPRPPRPPRRARRPLKDDAMQDSAYDATDTISSAEMGGSSVGATAAKVAAGFGLLSASSVADIASVALHDLYPGGYRSCIQGRKAQLALAVQTRRQPPSPSAGGGKGSIGIPVNNDGPRFAANDNATGTIANGMIMAATGGASGTFTWSQSLFDKSAYILRSSGWQTGARIWSSAYASSTRSGGTSAVFTGGVKAGVDVSWLGASYNNVFYAVHEGSTTVSRTGASSYSQTAFRRWTRFERYGQALTDNTVTDSSNAQPQCQSIRASADSGSSAYLYTPAPWTQVYSSSTMTVVSVSLSVFNIISFSLALKAQVGLAGLASGCSMSSKTGVAVGGGLSGSMYGQVSGSISIFIAGATPRVTVTLAQMPLSDVFYFSHNTVVYGGSTAALRPDCNGPSVKLYGLGVDISVDYWVFIWSYHSTWWYSDPYLYYSWEPGWMCNDNSYADALASSAWGTARSPPPPAPRPRPSPLPSNPTAGLAQEERYLKLTGTAYDQTLLADGSTLRCRNYEWYTNNAWAELRLKWDDVHFMLMFKGSQACIKYNPYIWGLMQVAGCNINDPAYLFRYVIECSYYTSQALRIIHEQTGLCLTLVNTNDANSQVILSQCTGGRSQAFDLYGGGAFWFYDCYSRKF